MKIVKPMRLGVVPRVFMNQRTPHLLITAFAGFSYEKPARLLYEPTVWTMATEELGKDGLLDEFNPKTRGELLVTGRCYPPGRVARPASSVRVKLGSIDKNLYVIGDRTWGLLGMSDPTPFTEMPVTWRNAFGGEGFAKNPLGKGHGDKGAALPNIESPRHLIRARGDRPAPAGLDGYDVTWPQRFSKVGTYDTAWREECFPGFARDMDPTLFNMAPDDQQIDGFFRGDETFVVENMHPDKPRIEGALPGVASRCFICLKTSDGVEIREPAMKLDTVRLFPHRERGVVLFRGGIEVADDDAKDVVAVLVACEAMGAPRPAAYYHEYLAPRLGLRNPDLPDDEDDMLMPEPEDPEAPPLPDDRLSGLASRLRRQGFLGGTPDRAVRGAAAASAAAAGVAATGVRGAGAERDPDIEEMEADLAGVGIDPEHLGAAANEDQPDPAMDLPEGREEEESLAWSEPEPEAHHDADPEPIEPAAATTAPDLADDADDAEMLRQQDAILELAKKRMRDQGIDPEAYLSQQGPTEDPEPLDESEEAAVSLVESQIAGRALKTEGVDVGALLAEARRSAADQPGEISVLETRERLRQAMQREGVAPDKTEEILSTVDWQGLEDEPQADLDDDISDEALEAARAQPEEPAGDTFPEDEAAEFSEGESAEFAEDEFAEFAEGDAPEFVEDEAAEFAEDDAPEFAEGLDEKASLRAEWGQEGRLLAHFLPASARLDGEESLRFRHEVEAGHKEGRSFAGCDLTGADLSHLDLAGIDFSGAILESAFLNGSDLRKANLTGAILAHANLEGADLSEAKLDGANLGSACLRDLKALGGVDFGEAVLVKADLWGADLSGAKLSGADLSEANLRDTNLEGVVAEKATFHQVDLTGARLLGARLSGSTFNEVNVTEVDFTGVDLSSATFIAAEGDGAIFRDVVARDLASVKGSSFAGADFSGATLTGANLMGTRLRGSDFSNADLRGALLDEADLTEATLDGASLVEAMLTRTNLTGASLYAADLRQSVMNSACVRGAIFEKANLFGVCADRMIGDDDTSFEGANIKRLRVIPAEKQHG
ncbi:DUF2169 domain-containing protein [Sorangium sp. So ce269]